jgi:hypothetical protein
MANRITCAYQEVVIIQRDNAAKVSPDCVERTQSRGNNNPLIFIVFGEKTVMYHCCEFKIFHGFALVCVDTFFDIII